MKIYFTTSSTGVKNKTDEARVVIKQIEKSGHKLALKWIKQATDKDDPLKGRPANPQKIFQENLAALTKSDACIFEISDISLGLTYQITYALTKQIPTLCLYDKNIELEEMSNFIPGIKSKHVKFKQYQDDESLKKAVKDYLADVKKKSLVKFNFIATKEIKDYLDWASKKKGVSRSQYLRNILYEKIIDQDKEYKKSIR